MEVDPNIDVLGLLERMEIVPPHRIDMGVCMLGVAIMDAMLPIVVIEGIDVCGPRLKGLGVRVPTYKNTSG